MEGLEMKTFIFLTIAVGLGAIAFIPTDRQINITLPQIDITIHKPQDKTDE